MTNSDSYKVASNVYRNLTTSTNTRNRKVKIAAIKRAIDKLGNCVTTNVVTDRSSLPEIPRLILTYTTIVYLSEDELHMLKDVERYLNGEVGD